MFGRLGLPELLFLVVVVGGFCLWIWMLIEAVTKERPESQDRLIWVLVVLLGGPLGGLIYYFARRSKRIAELGA